MADFGGAMFPLVKTLTVYTQNQREIPEMVARAFQYGTYSRVLEFINFSERVSNSVQRALTIRQTVRLELFRRVGNSTSVASVVGKENAGGKNGSSEVDEYLRIVDLSGLNFEGSSDNRDKTVAIEFTKDRKVLNGISNSGVFPSEKPEWIKQYTLIPKILKQIVVGGIDDELQTLLSELEKHQTDIAKVIVSGVQLIFEQTKNEEMDDSKIDTVCSILIENANNVEKFGPNWKKVGEMIRLSTETLELFIVTSIILRKLQSYLPPQTKKQKKTATITQSAESSKNAAKVITFKERVVESRTKMVGVMKLWQDLVAGEEVFGDCVDEFKSDAWSLVKEAKMMEKVTKNLKEDWSVSLKNLSSGFSAKEV
ncbi:hypothetical protein HK098_004706 [Nowakowskiella sp. JEL0407]|nr:hypothetical protein HK098_004706 [Nowakowskiella sp. JEL0407]